MEKSKYIIPILLVLALAACGGSGSTAKLSSADIAVVGSTHVTQVEFTEVMAEAKQNLGTKFPKQGTTAYQTLKSEGISLLVQQAERAEKAKALGITITPKAIQTRLTAIKKQYFGGSEKKYLAQLKTEHVTDAQVRDEIKTQLISEALEAKLTKNTTVSKSAIDSYYLAHKSSYVSPATRQVRHILVKTQALADQLYQQLKSGNNQAWCTLAKKYSQDPSSKNICGKLTVQKGQTVAQFDKVAFSQPTGVVHAPVHSPQYGYFVIEPLANIKPQKTVPESQVSASIKTQLLQTKKNQVMTDWVTSVSKQFCSGSKIKYQAGYQPNPDPCTAITSKTTTT